MAKPKKSLNERFTILSDKVTYSIGTWWFAAISLIFVIVWFAFGPMMHFSDTWQLTINTPTTLGEWFLAAFTLAAANRVERRTHDLLEEIRQHAKADLHTTERVERKVTGEE